MVYQQREHYEYRDQYRDKDRYERYRYEKQQQSKISVKDDSRSDEEGPMPVRWRRANVILGLIPMFGYAFVLGAPYWRTTLGWFGVARVTGYWMFEGLFLVCLRQGYQALSQCYNLYPIMGTVDGEVGVRSGKDFNLYPYLTSFRAMMVIALLFTLVGVVCSALGLRCATVLEENSKQKRWVLIAGGISHIIAGAITGICVSWYAGEVVYQYYSPYYQAAKMKYTIGACLYVGWICMAISIVCGSLMSCCTCCRKEKDEYEIDPFKVKQLMAQPARTVDNYMDKESKSSMDESFYRESRRGSRFHDSDIDAAGSRRGSKRPDDDFPPRTRRESRVELDKQSSHRRMSRQHEPSHYTESGRRVSRVHDSDLHQSSAPRRTSRVDKPDFQHSAARRNSRKVSILAEDVAQLLISAGMSDHSPKTNRRDSVIHEDESGFV